MPEVPLGRLLADIDARWAGLSEPVRGLSLDSRETGPGSLFVACRGMRVDRGRFVDQAIEAGAAAVLTEPDFSARRAYSVPVLPVANLRRRLGWIASRFHGDPSRRQRVIGVTGTNGKSTVVWQLSHALSAARRPTAMIGTLGCGLPGQFQASGLTTPDAIGVQALLASWAPRVQGTVMEVSSHALVQWRVSGVCFDTAVLTQIARDHLDYHGDMTAYAAAKFRLFESPGLRRAVLNLDDRQGRMWLEKLPRRGLAVYGYTRNPATLEQYRGRCAIVCAAPGSGPPGAALAIRSPWGEGQLRDPCTGAFSVENLLASLVVLGLSGVAIEKSIALLEAVPAAPGRMEFFGGGRLPLVVVDYAHTPAALRQALQALRARAAGSLSCVFGCGGDRDRGKRKMMGEIAGQLADRVILTDDNPRQEPSGNIINDILSGLPRREQVQVITSRAEAIRTAFAEAAAGDVILLAGKGHETEQQFRDQAVPFSDRALAEDLCSGMER